MLVYHLFTCDIVPLIRDHGNEEYFTEMNITGKFSARLGKLHNKLLPPTRKKYKHLFDS